MVKINDKQTQILQKNAFNTQKVDVFYHFLNTNMDKSP